MSLELKSSAFDQGDMIPDRYTCDGENISPPLVWKGVPEGTESLALIMEDIDSVQGIWSHWVLVNIPPDVHLLPEGVPAAATLLEGRIQGQNDFEEIGYGGPCPSDGRSHRYEIRLFALNEIPDFAPGGTREDVLEEVEGSVIEETVLSGYYQRFADRE
jgi:hypothetical protein